MTGRTRKLLNILSEETLIPISFAILLGGGLIWLTNIAFQVSANSAAISSLEKKQDDSQNQVNTQLKMISEDVSYIRGLLDGGMDARRKSGGKRHISN